MSASITLDELTLLADDASERAADAANGYHFEVSADGTEWTNAEAAITSVQSQLFDGEAIAQGSYSNLEATLMVRVVAQDSAKLATGCAVLTRVLRRPGMRELTYMAPDGASPATVFDVLHSTPAMQWGGQNESDIHEELRNIRTYSLTLLCKPFPRSQVELRTDAVAEGSPTVTVLDSLASSTSWAAQDPAVASLPHYQHHRSWTPLRYAIITNPLTSDSYRTQGWSAGGGATSISWVSDSGTGHMSVAGKPTSTSTRIYANAPMAKLVGTGAIRWRLRMGSSYTGTYGALYRWYDASSKQIGSDATITEVARSGTSQDVSALITPPSGAVYVRMYPYMRFSSVSGTTRTWTANTAFLGSDGASFIGFTANTTTTAYDWTDAAYGSSQVELGFASMVSASGSVSVTGYDHSTSDRFTPALTRTGALTTTASQPYLVISGQVTGAPPAVRVDGLPGSSWVGPDAIATAADGTFKAYFQTGDLTWSGISIGLAPNLGAARTVTLKITRLERASSLPAIGTGRQAKFSLDVQGTMPAEASLQVANTGGVGSNVIIYTGPSNGDFTPALSPSLVAAGTTDSASISNKKFTVATSAPAAETWEVPHGGLVDSTYALFAKVTATGLASGSAYTFSVAQHSSPDGGATYYGDSTVTTGQVIASSGIMINKFVQLATLRLPCVYLDGAPDGIEGLKLWVSGGTWVLDEAWLFDLVNGSVSHVNLPSTNYPNVTIRAASPDHPQQRYMVDFGDGTTRDLGGIGRVQIWGNHRLDPATGCDVFAICDAALPDLSASASYYPRWDVFAAPLDEDVTD